MTTKNPKHTFYGQTAQSLLKSAHIVDGRLLVRDRNGSSCRVQRAPNGALSVTDVASGWGAALLMDDWCRAELAWWEAQLDALTPGRTVWVVLEVSGVVVGHLAAPELAHDPERAHPFRVDNAARRPLPALGEPYSPPPEPVRPRKTRGMSVMGEA